MSSACAEPESTPPVGQGMGGARRFVTVLFSDVSDSSRHAETLEAEEYAALLERFRAFARAIVPRHGGSIARLQGDGMLALFGHLKPSEDDGRHAADAALELHAAVARLRAGSDSNAAPLQMHSGIHAGLVLVIEGDIERGRFDVVGEVPNTAARLCSMASGGELLVSEETLGPHANFFVVASRRRVVVRGRSASLDVLRVTGARAMVGRRIDAAAQRGVVPFVGRDADLQALLAAAHASTIAAAPSVLHIAGEPGVGKTRLLDEFQLRLDRAAFWPMSGYCEGHLGAEPLQPFMQMLRTALHRHEAQATPPHDDESPLAAEAGGELWAACRTLLGIGVTPVMPAPARVDAIVRVLATLATGRTLVLVVDDWQWADDASRVVLQAILAACFPLLAVIAERSGMPDDDPALAGAHRVVLLPLAPSAAAHAIGAWLPNAEPFLVQEISRQAGGSPLFIEELCHQAAAGAEVSVSPPLHGAAWINGLVASRVGRLPLREAEILQLAAVAGAAFPRWLLARLTNHTPRTFAEVEAALDGFLSPADGAGTLRFRHALTHDAVYATVELTQRRALHLRVAQLLEAEVGDQQGFEPLEALAYHYDAAGRSEQAAHFAEAAGDKALVAMALDRARAHFLTALRSLDALPTLSRPMRLQWCAIAQKLGQTCVFDPLDVGYGFVMFERAVQLAREAEDGNALARAEYWLGYVNYGRGRPREAVRHTEAALRHALDSGDQRLVIQVQATLGQSLASAGRYDRAIPLLRDAVESKRKHSRPGSGTAIGSAYSLGRLGYTLGDMGRFDEAAECFHESLCLLGDTVHSVGASVRELIGAVHLWQGRWAEARDAAFAGAELALRCRSRYLTAMGRALGSCGAWALDHDERALGTLRDTTRWIDVRGGAVSTSLNHGWLVEATLVHGLVQEARLHAARLFRRARLQDTHGLAIGCRALARAMSAGGDTRLAEHYLSRADHVAQARGSARERAVNLLARAEMLADAGRFREARALFDASGEAFERMQMSWHAARARTLPA